MNRTRPTTVAALARACSMFLRKTVLGGFGKRETRLLDDDVLETLAFRFHPLVKIPREFRRLIRVEFGGIRGGALQITKLNDDTFEPERTYTAPMGPQTLHIGIEWPCLALSGGSECLRSTSLGSWRRGCCSILNGRPGWNLSYDVLLDNKSVARPKGDMYRVKLGVACDADQSQSETPNWASFGGTMMMAYHNAPMVIRHEIRPVGKG